MIPEWTTFSYETLQNRLEAQRQKPPRLRIPSWAEVGANLPHGLMKRPSDIIWYRIVFGYAPELAVPFEVLMRTAGAEASTKWDRIFGQSLFWVTTRAVKCPYCMGHCEMNWEVAGLNSAEIAERSRLLSGNDWSSFTPAEQHAFAFARKLTKTPGNISRDDVEGLVADFGLDRAIIVMLNASRYHYMTRISNGFQLTLERENVFYDYYNVQSPSAASLPSSVTTGVPMLSVEECWKRMPGTVSGGGQAACQTGFGEWPLNFRGRRVLCCNSISLNERKARLTQSFEPKCGGWSPMRIAALIRKPYALADLERAGLDAAGRQVLTGNPKTWDEADREPLEFARQLTLAAPKISDQLFESLRTRYGEKRVAAMVLLAAYGNFQDRIVLGLNLPMEASGPLPPLEIQFVEDAFQIALLFPPANTNRTTLAESGYDGRTRGSGLVAHLL